MTRCVFCGKDFAEYDGMYRVPDDDIETLMQICPECMSKLCNALRGWR